MDLSLESEKKKEQEMIRSDFLYKLDNLDNYESNYYFKETNYVLVDYIHNNYEKLSDEEMTKFLIKILDIKQVKKFLLVYDLLNYKPVNRQTLIR